MSVLSHRINRACLPQINFICTSICTEWMFRDCVGWGGEGLHHISHIKLEQSPLYIWYFSESFFWQLPSHLLSCIASQVPLIIPHISVLAIKFSFYLAPRESSSQLPDPISLEHISAAVTYIFKHTPKWSYWTPPSSHSPNTPGALSKLSLGNVSLLQANQLLWYYITRWAGCELYIDRTL